MTDTPPVLPTTGRYTIVTEGFGTLIWEPDPKLIEQYSGDPTEAPPLGDFGNRPKYALQGQLAGPAIALAHVAEAMSVSLQMVAEHGLPGGPDPVIWGSIVSWLINTSGQMLGSANGWCNANSVAMPPHEQKLSATALEPV